MGKLIDVEVTGFGGVPSGGKKGTLFLTLLGRWMFWFDFCLNFEGRRIHYAPNGDIHHDAVTRCDRWPCFDADLEEILDILDR